MAAKICVGAARNSGFATTTRLRNSHSSNPVVTETRPARWMRRSAGVAVEAAAGAEVLSCSTVADMSVDQLRDARQDQLLDRQVADIAELAQGGDNRVE